MTLLKELQQRLSPNVMSEKDVPSNMLESLIEAARWAPSCFNNQEWNYVFVHKTDASRHNLESALSLGNGWAKRAPFLVAVGCDPKKDCSNNNLPYYAYDAGLSVMSLVVQAEHMGLRVHQMAGYNEQMVKDALEFSDKHRVIVLFALGYEGEIDTISDKLVSKAKDALTKARTRKPKEERFFFGKYQGKA